MNKPENEKVSFLETVSWPPEYSQAYKDVLAKEHLTLEELLQRGALINDLEIQDIKTMLDKIQGVHFIGLTGSRVTRNPHFESIEEFDTYFQNMVKYYDYESLEDLLDFHFGYELDKFNFIRTL